MGSEMCIRDRLKTILNLPAPTNASEVRGLLGMMNFCGAHSIHNYAALSHELRHLTKKTTQWSWTKKHDAALHTVKAELSKATTLAFFDPRKATEIYTDASPVGISAALTQDDRRNSVCEPSSHSNRTTIFTDGT